MKFEEVTREDFPIEDCTIPIKTNKNYFRTDSLKSVLFYDKKFNSIRIENMYPCISSEDNEDLLGFCTENEYMFYKLEDDKYIIKGMMDAEEIAFIIEEIM